jgi:hypothetical protein
VAGLRRIFVTTRAQIIIRWEQRDKMKSRTIEIIDNHIKALEEELEWYQAKNREWQEKYETLEKQKLIEPYPNFMTFLGKPIDYWLTLQHYAKTNSVDELVVEVYTLRNENARLRDDLKKSEKRNVQLMEIQQAAQNEINRLGDLLRWHPVSELPRTDVEKLWTVNVFMVLEDEVEVIIAYYSIKSNCWYEYLNSDVLEVNDKSRWCYIPEGGDA